MRLVLDLDLVTAADLCTALRRAIDAEVARTAPKKPKPLAGCETCEAARKPTSPKRRGPPTKKMTIKQAAESHRRHLEKAAARTKKWREKKGESNG